MYEATDGSYRPLLRLTVFGIPRPKGSIDPRRHGGLTQPKTTMNWCHAVAAAALAEADSHGIEPYYADPVSVWLQFFMPGSPTAKPDIDKLERAILDAISGGTTWGFPFIKDDAQVTSTVTRVYGWSARPRAHIDVIEDLALADPDYAIEP